MRNLKPLIKDQKISIDPHLRGTGELNDWEDERYDIHVHKTTNVKLHGEVESVDIRLPINSDRKASFKIKNAHSPLGEDKLTKEIQAVLSDTKRLQVFIDDLLKVLDNYSTKTLGRRDRALQAAKRLARHFGLTHKEKEIVTYINEKIEAVAVTYSDEEHNFYEVKLDQQEITFEQTGSWAKGQRRRSRKKY